MAHFSFADTIEKIRNTPKGKEAAMYGPIRDILVHVLGYPAGDVDIDVTGEGGRPDVTARALSGLKDAKGKDKKIDWIVVEAKDEVGCFRNNTSREDIFDKKSKYIGPNTSWFVMIEPEIIVVRQVTGKDFSAASDIELLLADLDQNTFEHRLLAMRYDRAGVPEMLKKFREGDTKLIATEKLNKPDPATATKRQMNRFLVTRKRFYQSVREATDHLQNATRSALLSHWDDIANYKKLADEFGKKYDSKNGNWTFAPHTLTIESFPSGLENSQAHDKEAIALRREFKKAPHLARLALDGLPTFQARTGADDKVLLELFSIETANLILARILLLRFFEDNGFFGKTRYVCNGGVEAFQKMRTYFEESYTKLLEEAYRKASQFYSAAFDETELDWILTSNNQGLSNAIEWAMFQLSRYDFTTIKGDILTGIYDRFMDRNQRKKLGEFYTPPSIARYIVKRVGIDINSRVMDPACGSGTFLIEAYREMIGEDIDRGAASYSDALDVITRICGNDLNTFSSVLAQIQILWQILSMRDEIKKLGFPDIPITGKVNSLVVPNKLSLLDRFSGELDRPIYDAIIGNPPYIRQERSEQDLDKETLNSFEHGRGGFPGISAKRNAYTLFIYRALLSWCKPQSEFERAGRLGFIVPGSLFSSNETEDLRDLFKIGGRWTITEIIDMEVIWNQVFDAKTLPVIIIAENRPAKLDDMVSIRLASQACVKHDHDSSLASFDLHGLQEQLVPYPDIFTPDGRIMTRLTPDRLNIIRKLWENKTLTDAAKIYWVGKSKDAKGKKSDQTPKYPEDWQERRMITRGVVFRNQKAYSTTGKGYDIYKGENVVSAELQGDPIEKNIDMNGISDNSLWSIADLLPSQGFAFAGVAHTLNAVSFDPKKIAFTDTTTLFFPAEELSTFPFDILFLSNVYVFFYAIAARMGALDALRSHIYPTNVALLPWSDSLAHREIEIEDLRVPIISACKKRFQAKESLLKELAGLGLKSLKGHLQADKSSHMSWSECLEDSNYSVTIGMLSLEERESGEFLVRLSADILEYLEINKKEIAVGLTLALQQLTGEETDRSGIHNLPIPVTEEEQTVWANIVMKYDEPALVAEMDARLADLDRIVGECLGLKEVDVDFIQIELKTDPFLLGIKPRYPGTTTRKQGLRTGLNSSERYSS